MTAADNNIEYFFLLSQKKIRLDVSCESSARQRIHKKHPSLIFSERLKLKKKCRLLQFCLALLEFRVLI